MFGTLNALFVPFKFSSHCPFHFSFYRGFIVHVVIYVCYIVSGFGFQTPRSGRGLGSNLYTMLSASLLLRFVFVITSIFCPYDYSEYAYSTL